MAIGKSLEALPGVAYLGFRDNRSTLHTKTGLKKKSPPAVVSADNITETTHTLNINR